MRTNVRVHRKTDTEPMFPDLDGLKVVKSELSHFGILEGGMDSGLCSVAIMAKLPDGKVVMIETSARLFMQMAGAVKVACGSWGETV